MSVITDRVLSQLSYLLIGDAESDQLLTAIATGLLVPAERLSAIAHGDGVLSTVAWQILTDPRYAPLWALPYAAQWTGGTMPAQMAGETDDAYLARARMAVVRPRGMFRGSARSLLEVGIAYLTGTKTARVVERVNDDPWLVHFIVRPGEVSDSDALTAALNDPGLVPAGMKVVVIESDSPLIDEGTRTIDTATGVIDTATLADIT